MRLECIEQGDLDRRAVRHSGKADNGGPCNPNNDLVFTLSEAVNHWEVQSGRVT